MVEIHDWYGAFKDYATARDLVHPMLCGHGAEDGRNQRPYGGMVECVDEQHLVKLVVYTVCSYRVATHINISVQPKVLAVSLYDSCIWYRIILPML